MCQETNISEEELYHFTNGLMAEVLASMEPAISDADKQLIEGYMEANEVDLAFSNFVAIVKEEGSKFDIDKFRLLERALGMESGL